MANYNRTRLVAGMIITTGAAAVIPGIVLVTRSIYLARTIHSSTDRLCVKIYNDLY